jgi:hypothetical protein
LPDPPRNTYGGNRSLYRAIAAIVLNSQQFISSIRRLSARRESLQFTLSQRRCAPQTNRQE